MPSREAGQVLGGRYRLVDRLGGGGMGSVWRAEHLSLNSPVAIKVIDPATAREPDALHRFLREARTAAALRSPHVVQILDYGVDGDNPYIVMELLEGESLAERLNRQACLGARETARVIQHISRALGRAHEAGIVHRDLKPENVFIVKNDDDVVVKVLDFGIVKAAPNAFGASTGGNATRTGTLLGTPYFMSPEQAEGVKSLDHRADIWALGVLAYRCLLGKLPFTGDSVGRLILEICSRPLPVPSERGPVPDGFDAWFATACAREPSARFESAKRAASELSRLTDATSAASEAPPTHAPARPPLGLANTTLMSSNTEVLPSTRRRPRQLAIGLGACALLSLMAAISVRVWKTPHPGGVPAGVMVEQHVESLGTASAAPAAGPGEPARREAAPAVPSAPGQALTPAPELALTASPEPHTAPPAPAQTSGTASPRVSGVATAPRPALAASASASPSNAAKTPSRARRAPEHAPPPAGKPKVDLGI
jgi:serine/threonine protein kinase